MADLVKAIRGLTAQRSSYDGLTTKEAFIVSTIKPPSISTQRKPVVRALLEAFAAGTLPRDVKALVMMLEAAGDTFAGKLVDDRDLLLEYLVTLMADLEGSAVSYQISTYLIETLFNDLPRPPTSRVTREHEFRSADGSGNSLAFPMLGASHQSYARSVQTKAPRLNQPDAGLVFDMLLRRKEFTPHPNGISSLLFAQANIIIHDIFKTNKATGANDHSSYLDLQGKQGEFDAHHAAFTHLHPLFSRLR